MALEVSMTGTGTIGDITPGWSVNEFATPVTIGSSSSGTGTVSFTAKANDDSLMCINNDVVSTVNGFGTIHGVVQSVSQTGLNVSLTHGSLLDKLNLDISMPPLLGGDVVSTLDYFEQDILGVARTTKTSGQFFTMAGHGYAFINDGTNKAVFQQPTAVEESITYVSTSDEEVIYDYLDIRNELSCDNFVRLNNKIYANNITGHMFYSQRLDESNIDRGSRIYYKTFLNGANNTLNILGNLYNLNFDWDLDANFVINYSAKTISFTGEYALGGTPEPLTASASIASLNVDTELAVFLNYYVTPGGNYTLKATVCNTSNYSIYVTVTQTLSNQATPVISNWDMTGIARDIYIEVNGASDASLTTETYTVDSTFYVDESTRQPTAPVISYSGVFWEYIQMGCAACSQEISINGDVITIRDIGTRTFDITNVVASPTISPTSTLSGKQINIPYTDSAFVSGTVYSAADDGNNIISVNAGETTVTSVKHNTNPIYVTQPTRSDTWPVTAGQYYVIDSAGVRLLAGEWEAYGASVTVEIDHEDTSAIQVTIVGPYTDVTVAGGPYELAASDGSNKYASLEIAGTGVYSGDNVLGLLTGIDPDKYTRATVNTITNPFVSSEEVAYDRGVWAAQKASGPTVSLSAQIPSSSISGLGLTCGALVDYRDSTYRITSCSISGIGASITAERHVTVADVDALWSAKTVAQYDGFWGNYECQDQIIFPYKVA